SLDLSDLGFLFRFWTWEYLQLTAAKAERLGKKDPAKVGSSSAEASGSAEEPNGEADASASTALVASGANGEVTASAEEVAGEDEIPEEAIDSPSTSKKPLATAQLSNDPELANLDVWQEMSGAMSTTIRDFFQELTRLLSPRRSSEASSLRRFAPNAMEQISQCIMSYYKWIGDMGGDSDFPEIGYATIVLRHTLSMLYEERSNSSSRTQTQLIFKFFQVDGFKALIRLYDTFSRELTKHFEETKPDQSGHVKHALKFHHICGAMRILLTLFQNLVTSKLIHESTHTAQLLLKEEPKSSANYFEPADLLVRMRAEVLSVINASLVSNWLYHLPVSVNRLVIQIMLEILRAEGETPVITKKDEAQQVQDRFANSILSSLTSATAIRRATAAATVNETQVRQLADMGFPRAAARHALLRTNNDVAAATEYLIVHPDIVQSMQDEPTGSSTPSGAEAAPAAEGSSSNAESSTAAAAAAATGSAAAADGDIAMDDSTSSSVGASSSSQPSASNGKAPENKAPEKDQPFTDAGMAAKDKLDKEREETRGNIFQRTLDLANHHEDLVFEVRDAFGLVASDKARASESLQAVLGIVLSAGPAAFGEQEKLVAVRMHAMAVIMNDDKLLKNLDDETTESAMSVCMMLIQEYEAQRKPDAHPSWFASNLLTVAPLLSSEYDILKVDSAEMGEAERGPLPLDKIMPNFEKFASERSELLQYCLTVLKQPALLKREGLLAVLRILVHLTRRRAAAAEFLKGGGMQLLFQPFKTIPASEQSQCQAQTVIILRNVIEDADTLRFTMEQELQSYLTMGRTKTVDISSITRQHAHVIMRDPEMFLAVVKERLQMTEWSAVKDNGSVRFIQAETPAATTAATAKTPLLSAEQHEPDTSFGAPPASPTKGAHDFDMDASMHELGGERADVKTHNISESAESVIHFLLSELHKSTKDAAICRNIAPQPPKSALPSAVTKMGAFNTADAGSTPARSLPHAAKPAEAQSASASTGTAGEAAAESTDKAAQDATYLFSCFLMQTLMELLSSYVSCKLAFINLCRRRASTNPENNNQPRLKVSMLQYLLNELIPAGFVRTEDHESLRKRMAQTNLAMSVVVALTADVAASTSLRETPQDLVGVRRYVLDGIIKSIRDAVTSSETTEMRYGRIYAQSDLCYRLLTARPNVAASKPGYDASLHMAKTMLEKHFVTVLTTTLGEIDLKLPTIKPLLDTILRPLEYLTKAAIKMGKAERKAKEEGDELDEFMTSDESDTESESLSTLEEEAMLERDQRQETPDFYRNSSLGMHTGEMEQQPIYDDEEMEDEDEMDEDDVDMGEYDTEEEGSDLSSLEGEEVDIDDMSDDEMSDEDSDGEDEDDEDDEMDDDDDEEGEDDDSWATEDEEDVEGEGGDEVEGALDFVLGDGEEGDDLADGAIVEGYAAGGIADDGLLGGAPALVGGEIEDDDADSQEDGLSAEDPYDMEEFAHLEFADEVAAVGRGQADDRFGANWGWAAIPPSQLMRDAAGGSSHLNATSSRSRRRLAMLDQALHGAPRPATSGDGAAYHPLLEQRPTAAPTSRATHSHRGRGRYFNGLDGHHDVNGGFMHSFEEMMGTGTMQFLENLVGLAPSETSIRIDVAGGPGGMGQFHVDGDPSVLEQLFGRSSSRSVQSSSRTAPKQEDPVALAQLFNPLPTSQRWSEAARIVHNSETLERSQRLKGHIINVLYPAFKVYKAEEERKREAEQELRRKNLEAKAKAKDIEDKMSQSLTLTSAQEGTSGQNTPAETSAASAAPTASAEDSFATAQESADASRSNAAEASAEASVSVPEASADIEMADGENETGATTPRASTPRPTETSSSSTAPAAEPASAASVSAPGSGAESSAGAASSSNSAQPAQRQYTYVHGQRIDITDTGIDPTFLEALPDDMREEVLNQHFRERRAAATTAAAANSSIAPEFLDALPPEIRAEVIQQEAMENARRRAAEANAANGAAGGAEASGNDEEGEGEPEDEGGEEAMDPAALLAQLNPSLRTSLLENPDELLAGLQDTLLGGAGGSRRRHHHHHHRSVAAGADAAAAAKKPPPRDAIQLLDKGGVATLIRLFFFPDMNGRKNGLNNILSNLSENSRTRADLLSLLLSILSDGTTDPSAVDRSFSSMSIRASRTSAVTAAVTPNRPTPKRSSSGLLNLTPGGAAPSSLLTNSTTAPISVIGDEAPFLIATRVLESLLHLTTVNEQAATFFLKDDARLIKKTGKGKDKEKADSATAKAAGTAPINTLLMLLKRPDILANAQLVDALLAVLNTVTKPLVSLQAKKNEAQASTPLASGSASAQAASSSSSSSAPAASAPATAPSADTASAPAAAAGEPAVQASDLLETAPQIASDRLAAVVRPLATPISSKGFQHTLSVASHLASIDGARDTIGGALKTEAEAASRSLIAELDRLLESLPAPKPTPAAAEKDHSEMDTDQAGSAQQQVLQLQQGGGEAGSVDTERKFDSPALTALASPASAQAVFLRSLRALDYLMTGR
ncbi:E3 ubiquitin-protein ligase tom1, partial [Tilletia horrida]